MNTCVCHLYFTTAIWYLLRLWIPLLCIPFSVHGTGNPSGNHIQTWRRPVFVCFLERVELFVVKVLRFGYVCFIFWWIFWSSCQINCHIWWQLDGGFSFFFCKTSNNTIGYFNKLSLFYSTDKISLDKVAFWGFCGVNQFFVIKTKNKQTKTIDSMSGKAMVQWPNTVCLEMQLEKKNKTNLITKMKPSRKKKTKNFWNNERVGCPKWAQRDQNCKQLILMIRPTHLYSSSTTKRFQLNRLWSFYQDLNTTEFGFFSLQPILPAIAPHFFFPNSLKGNTDKWHDFNINKQF